MPKTTTAEIGGALLLVQKSSSFSVIDKMKTNEDFRLKFILRGHPICLLRNEEAALKIVPWIIFVNCPKLGNLISPFIRKAIKQS